MPSTTQLNSTQLGIPRQSGPLSGRRTHARTPSGGREGHMGTCCVHAASSGGWACCHGSRAFGRQHRGCVLRKPEQHAVGTHHGCRQGQMRLGSRYTRYTPRGACPCVMVLDGDCTAPLMGDVRCTARMHLEAHEMQQLVVCGSGSLAAPRNASSPLNMRMSSIR